MKSLGYFQSLAATAKTLVNIATTVPASSDFCYVSCESQACRWRDDGTAPTASVGQPLAAGDTLVVRRSQYANFKIIEQTSAAKVNVTFYKTG